MSEFEELALKKITKYYLVDCVYLKINTISSRYGISNAEISKRIGWDPAGFNQKYNRSNDLRITTFVKIFVALIDLIAEKEADMGMDRLSATKIQLDQFISDKECSAGALFNHISGAAEGREEFLNTEGFRETYREMRPFVLVGSRNSRFSEREMDVYISYYQTL